jgi:hypothetical protein
MKRTTTMIIFNEVETKDLCAVRYGLTSNRVLLFCSLKFAGILTDYDKTDGKSHQKLIGTLMVIQPKITLNI